MDRDETKNLLCQLQLLPFPEMRAFWSCSCALAAASDCTAPLAASMAACCAASRRARAAVRAAGSPTSPWAPDHCNHSTAPQQGAPLVKQPCSVHTAVSRS